MRMSAVLGFLGLLRFRNLLLPLVTSVLHLHPCHLKGSCPWGRKGKVWLHRAWLPPRAVNQFLSRVIECHCSVATGLAGGSWVPLSRSLGLNYKSMILACCQWDGDIFLYHLQGLSPGLQSCDPPTSLDNAWEALLLFFLLVLWNQCGRSPYSHFCLWGRNWFPGTWVTSIIT